MAARRTSDRTPAGRPAKAGGRETRTTSRLAEGAAEGEEAPKKGLGLPEAIGIVTFLMIVAAILLTDKLLGQDYGEGMFFK
jgi:hypothetical protein